MRTFKLISVWSAEGFAKQLTEAINDEWELEGPMQIVADPNPGYRAELCYVQLLSKVGQRVVYAVFNVANGQLLQHFDTLVDAEDFAKEFGAGALIEKRYLPHE
jgi:hypothetical protein